MLIILPIKLIVKLDLMPQMIDDNNVNIDISS